MNPLIIQVGVGEITLGMAPELAWLLGYLSNENLRN